MYVRSYYTGGSSVQFKESPCEGWSCALVNYRTSLINKNASMTQCTVILLSGFFYYFRPFFPTRGIAQTDMYTRNVCYYYCLRALCWLHCRELSCPTSITPTTCCFSTTMLQFCRKAVEKFGQQPNTRGLKKQWVYEGRTKCREVPARLFVVSIYVTVSVDRI